MKYFTPCLALSKCLMNASSYVIIIKHGQFLILQLDITCFAQSHTTV